MEGTINEGLTDMSQHIRDQVSDNFSTYTGDADLRALASSSSTEKPLILKPTRVQTRSLMLDTWNHNGDQQLFAVIDNKDSDTSHLLNYFFSHRWYLFNNFPDIIGQYQLANHPYKKSSQLTSGETAMPSLPNHMMNNANIRYRVYLDATSYPIEGRIVNGEELRIVRVGEMEYKIQFTMKSDTQLISESGTLPVGTGATQAKDHGSNIVASGMVDTVMTLYFVDNERVTANPNPSVTGASNYPDGGNAGDVVEINGVDVDIGTNDRLWFTNDPDRLRGDGVAYDTFVIREWVESDNDKWHAAAVERRTAAEEAAQKAIDDAAAAALAAQQAAAAQAAAAAAAAEAAAAAQATADADEAAAGATLQSVTVSWFGINGNPNGQQTVTMTDGVVNYPSGITLLPADKAFFNIDFVRNNANATVQYRNTVDGTWIAPGGGFDGSETIFRMDATLGGTWDEQFKVTMTVGESTVTNTYTINIRKGGESEGGRFNSFVPPTTTYDPMAPGTGF